MSAGSGIVHSEFNASKTDPVHFLQIWVMPDVRGIAPGYEQKAFASEEKHNRLRLVASRESRDGALAIHQDADIYAALIDAGAELTHKIRGGRVIWVQIARGSAAIAGEKLEQGDGIAISDATEIVLAGGSEGAEIILFDMVQ